MVLPSKCGPLREAAHRLLIHPFPHPVFRQMCPNQVFIVGSPYRNRTFVDRTCDLRHTEIVLFLLMTVHAGVSAVDHPDRSSPSTGGDRSKPM